MDLLVFDLCMYYIPKKYDIFCASSFRLRLREGKFEIILLNMGSHPKPNVFYKSLTADPILDDPPSRQFRTFKTFTK